MKNGKLFGKRVVVLASLIAVLSAAVFLNWKYAAVDGSMDVTGMLTGTQYLGDAQYVNEAVTNAQKKTTAKTTASDYFAETRQQREQSRAATLASLKEIVDDVKADDEAKSEASEKITQIADTAETETAIETLVCSKGFSDCIAVMTDGQINVVVKTSKKGLLDSETLQIQDIVMSSSKISLENIKIIEVK